MLDRAALGWATRWIRDGLKEEEEEEELGCAGPGRTEKEGFWPREERNCFDNFWDILGSLSLNSK